MCPYNYNNITNVNLDILSFWGLGGLRTSSLEAPGSHDTNLITLSTQTPRGQELLGRKWQIKMMVCFFSSLMKRGLNFMRIPKQSGFTASWINLSPKLAHILVNSVDWYVGVPQEFPRSPYVMLFFLITNSKESYPSFGSQATPPATKRTSLFSSKILSHNLVQIL